MEEHETRRLLDENLEALWEDLQSLEDMVEDEDDDT